MPDRSRQRQRSRRARRTKIRRRVAGVAAAAAAGSMFAVAPIATAPPAEAFFGLEDLFDPTIWADPGGWAGATDSLFDPAWTVSADQLFDPVALGLAELPGAGLAGWDANLTAAFDGLFAQTSHWVDGVLTQLSSQGGNALSLQALIAPSSIGTDAGNLTTGAVSPDPGVTAETVQTATVPLQVYNGTEPLVNISSGGGPTVPVVVDTGSAGLVLPWYDLGLGNIAIPTNFGISGYTGGIDYFYVTLPTTVDFGTATGGTMAGTDIVTGPTSVNAVLLTWPTSLQSLFTTFGTWQGFMNGTGADGVLGVGPNAVGPTPDAIPTAALPGQLGDGLLIDQANHTLTFGPNPLGSGAVSVAGAPFSNLYVQVGNGSLQPVQAVIDSGGSYGTMPSSVLGSTPATAAHITVYADPNGHTPLYSYTTDSTNAPTVVSGDQMNTGNMPFALQPIYISYSPAGSGTTTFGNPG